ncbi:MAG: 2-hydroxychromene-2-carboxylate isomerase [Rudaea sp.]
MKAQWYFDFISPFSYLQLPKLREWRTRLDITPIPIAFGALLAHNGNLGPAEIPGRREFTYRFVQWQADAAGIPLRFPPAHPFNPLAALRLCIAAGSSWVAIEAIFNHLWRDGRAGVNALQLRDVGTAIGVVDVEKAIDTPEVKLQLRANTDAAISAGVFGVPTLRMNGELFWGNDASPMVEDWLSNPLRFDSDEYRRIAALPVEVQRKR